MGPHTIPLNISFRTRGQKVSNLRICSQCRQAAIRLFCQATLESVARHPEYIRKGRKQYSVKVTPEFPCRRRRLRTPVMTAPSTPAPVGPLGLAGLDIF